MACFEVNGAVSLPFDVPESPGLAEICGVAQTRRSLHVEKILVGLEVNGRRGTDRRGADECR